MMKLPDTLPYCGAQTPVDEIVTDLLCSRMHPEQVLDWLARRYAREGFNFLGISTPQTVR